MEMHKKGSLKLFVCIEPRDTTFEMVLCAEHVWFFRIRHYVRKMSDVAISMKFRGSYVFLHIDKALHINSD